MSKLLLLLLLLLLGCVAVVAQRPIVVKLFRGRSVGLCVGASVCLSSALWKNGGSDPDAVRHHRSDASRDEARSGVWGSVHRKGYFWLTNLGTLRRYATVPRHGSLPKLLWADLLLFLIPSLVKIPRIKSKLKTEAEVVTGRRCWENCCATRWS